MREKDGFVQMIYNSRMGRKCLEWALEKKVDGLVVKFLWSPLSKIVIKPYIRMNHISMEDFEGQTYGCFRDFFARKREKDIVDPNPKHLNSPCDGWLSAFPIEEDSSFYIKKAHYQLGDLIQDHELAKEFYGGTCLIFRLCASDYHHYAYVDSGYQEEHHYIPGTLHSVQPAACEQYQVYTLNRRVWSLLRTENFGKVLQIEVGAFVVGGIVNEKNQEYVTKGMEKGHFELSGSTIALMFQKNQIELLEQVKKELEHAEEVRVLQGMKIGEVYEEKQV